MTTTAARGITLDLCNAGHDLADVATWATKGAALAALATLRENGLNRDRDIEVHQAETHLFWVWVIGRPDHFNGYTYLMASTGEWVRGRLYDATHEHPAPWQPLSGEPLPATVTHDYRFSAGPIGVVGHDGRPLMALGVAGRTPARVMTRSAFAWCIACTWSTNDTDDAVVRMRARYHRGHPDAHSSHTIPRRIGGRAA